VLRKTFPSSTASFSKLRICDQSLPTFKKIKSWPLFLENKTSPSRVCHNQASNYVQFDHLRKER